MSGRPRKAGLLGAAGRGLPGVVGAAGVHAGDDQEHAERSGSGRPVVGGGGAGGGAARRGADGRVPRRPARRRSPEDPGRGRWRRCWAICGRPGLSRRRSRCDAAGRAARPYRSWLVEERGLAATTVLRYENTARRFLQEQASREGFEPAALTGVDVNAFLLRECGRVSAGSAKGRVAELRSILRFLYLQGFTALPLGTAVPPVGGWRLATLPPPTMAAADVQRCSTAATAAARSASATSRS